MLLAYGEYNLHEAAILHQIAGEHDVVIEVGANIGSHTVGLAKKVGPQGRVIAYEPQPVVFQNLCANISINSLVNTECYQAAVGAKAGSIRVPNIRYDLPGNFGEVALGAYTEGLEVPLVSLDETFKYNRLKLIKMDVEGMESEVIAGAVGVIERFKPALYVENDRLDRSAHLIGRIRNLGYRLWWHLPPLFNPQNFAANPNNLFANEVSCNMICVHQSIKVSIDGPEIASDDERPQGVTMI